MKLIRRISAIFACTLLSAAAAFAQNVLTGTVTDAANGAALQYVMIYFKGTQTGCMTDEKGHFILDNPRGHTTLTAELMGYSPKDIDLTKVRKNTRLKIALEPEYIRLDAAVIKPKPARYSRKENPAVELIRKVVADKDRNRPERRKHCHAEEYDKLTLAMNEFEPDYGRRRRLEFAKAYVDTSELTGKPVLTVSVRESLADVYTRRDPKAKKTLVKAKRISGFDKDLDPSGALTANLETLFKNIDIYDNDIEIFTEHFTGPLSGELGIVFYKYYISDTTEVNGTPCTEISFVPANKAGFGFTGRLYVANDGSNALRKAILNTPAKLNLNWVDTFRLDQEFAPLPDSTYATSKVEAQMNLSINGQKPSIYAKKTATYRNYDFEPHDEVFREGDNSGANSIDLPDADKKDDSYWEGRRHIALKDSEAKADEIAAGLREIPTVDILTKIADVIITDFVPTSYPKSASKVDIGNVSAFVGGNAVEGFRMRIGARTKAALHPHWGGAGYVAYGFADHKFKYMGELIYSFNEMKLNFEERPRHRLVFKHEYDLYSAEETEFKDNVFFSLKSGELTRYMQYIMDSSVRYEKEWDKGITLSVGFNYKRFTPGGDLVYRRAADPSVLVNGFSVAPFSIGLRFAPGEKKYNGPKDRSNIAKNVPIFNMSHSYAPQGLFGTEYGYNRTDFSFWKRTWMSVAGVLDTKVKAGFVWSKVPFPLLIIPASSQSIMVQKETFHLMQPFEFVCDRYVSLDLTYRLKGLILNNIPLIRELKWREVITTDLIWGGLSDKNNPGLHPEGLFLLPEKTKPMGNVPYVEMGVGIENIFRIIHVYWYHRFTYLDVPGARKNGFGVGLHLDF